MATFSRNNRGFRNQQLGTTPRANARLDNARAALLESELAPKGPMSIIGGQFVEAGDTAGTNAALNGLRDRFATTEATQRMRRQMGSTTVRPGTPGGLDGGTALGADPDPAEGTPDLQSSGPNVSFEGGQFNFMQRPTQDFGAGEPRARPPLRSASNLYQNSTTLGDEFETDTGFRNGGMFTKQKTVKQPGFKGGGKVKMPVSVQDTLKAERRADPQYQAALEEAAAAGYYQPNADDPDADIIAVDRMMYDRNAPQREAEMQQMMQTREAPVAPPTGMRAPTGSPGYKWGSQAPEAPVAAPQAPARDGYRWDDEQGMRGYQQGGPVTDDWQYVKNIDGEMQEVPKPASPRAKDSFVPDPKASILDNSLRKLAHKRNKRGMMAGGAIGDDGADDGKDSVEVRVREGEYLLNPPTVAAAFGGGDYDAGVETLDQIVRETTGQEPGPTAVNEEGEAVRQGMRNGGMVKPGFAPGGGVQLDLFGNPVNQQYQFRPTGYVAPETTPYTRMDTRFQGPTAPPGATAPTAAKAGPSALRQAISGKHTTTVGDVVKGTGRGLQRSLRATGGGAGLIRGSAPVAGIMGGWQGLNTPTEDYAQRMGIDYPETMLGELGVRTAGVLSDVGTAFIDPFIELGNMAGADVPTLRSNFADVEAAGGTGASLPARWAGAAGQQTAVPAEQEEAPVAPDPYGRAFGAGDVNLPSNGLRSATEAVAPGGMNVVQRTGGPGDEAIIREDINGVPTFTNVRRGGFDGSSANLQREADARVAQDAQINARNEQVVDQMRQNAPAYGDQAEVRRSEGVQMKAAALAAASKAPRGKIADLDEQVKDRFQIAQYDDDGNLTGYENDQEKKIAFYDAMAAIKQGNPEFDPYALDRNGQNEIFDSFESVYDDTMKAMRAARAQGLPNSDLPRTGANGLRYLPGSNISLGDVWGPEATLGDYAAGIFSDAPINDGFVEDPLTGARIPARRAVRDPQLGLDRDAILRYGIPGQE